MDQRPGSIPPLPASPGPVPADDGSIAPLGRLLEAVFEELPDMVFVKEVRGLRFVALNRGVEEICGFPRREMIGRTDYDFFPEAQADFFTRVDREVIELRQAIDVPEEPVDTPNGRRYLHTKKTPILDEHGEPRFLLGISEDITEAVEYRAALEKGATRERLLGEVGMALVSSVDVTEALGSTIRLLVPSVADLCVVRVADDPPYPSCVVAAHADPSLEPVLVRVVKRMEGEACDAKALAHVREVEEPLLVSHWTETDTAHVSVDDEHRALLDSLDLRSAILLPLKARGRALGILAIAHSSSGRVFAEDDVVFARKLATRIAFDLDNLVLYQDAQAALRARDEFLSIASHELRTPLTPLLLQLQTLRRAFKDPQHGDTAHKIDVALRQVDRLRRLIDGLLDVSRIATGRFQLQLEEVSPSALVRDAVEGFREEAAAAGCELIVDAESPGTACWDRLRVEQLVANLLTNAIKYAPRAPILVGLEVEGDTARLTVRDHGPGLPPGKEEHVFRRFGRAVPSRAYGGLGLGLFIVRQVAEAHGGAAYADEHPEQGAAIVVELPLKPPPALRAPKDG